MAPECMERVFRSRLTQCEWKVLEDIKVVLGVYYSLLPVFTKLTNNPAGACYANRYVC
jgi:hypothetical protein